MILRLQRARAGLRRLPAVLDELLGDRGSALRERARPDVDDGRARHADRVDRAVLVVAPVLDRNHRVAHDRRDLLPGHEHAVLVGAQHAEHGLAVVGVDHAVGLLGELGDLELGEILRQRRHEAVEERDDAEREPGQHGDREPRLAQAHAAPHRRWRGVVERERRWGRRRDCHGRRGSDAGLRVPAGHSTPNAVRGLHARRPLLLGSALARAEHSCSRARLQTAASDRLCVCAAWSDRVVSVVAPSWRQVFENSIAWGSSTASGRSVDRSRFYKNIEPSWCRGPARGIAF